MDFISACALIVLAVGFAHSGNSKGEDRSCSGLAIERVAWDVRTLTGTPEPPLPFRTEPHFSRLQITQPLSFDIEPGRSGYLVLQHLGGWSPPGRLLRVGDDPQASDFDIVLDLGPGAIGYELAFHPKYTENGHLFIGQNLKVGDRNKTRVSRFTVDHQPPYRIDPASEVVIIEWDSNGHNGGAVDFGGDGMLYVTSGDGTSDSDTDLRGQDLTELTSKVLRIDVDRPSEGKNYSIPVDNPFVDRPGARPETWAYGFRNPWRMSYDRELDQLWVAQNGQDLWEAAVLVRRGANYGWSVTEGNHGFQVNRAAGREPISPVTVEHHHSEARSLTGGLVYRGETLPELIGAYVYGDYSTGKIWAVRHDGSRVTWQSEIADTPFQITGFGVDRQGELIVIDHVSGFHRLVRNNEPSGPPFPTRLSQTGLYESVHERRLRPGLVAYSVNSPLWSDGAVKRRAFAVPSNEMIDFKPGTQGWDFPEGSVVVKEFAYSLPGKAGSDGQPIETRILTKRQGEWVGYSYAWDMRGEDGVLVPKEGMDRTLVVADPNEPGGAREQLWHFPSRAECMVCHSRAANWVLGLSTAQMNREHDYGGVRANQIQALVEARFFKTSPTDGPDTMERLADPADVSASLERRARAYLHSNCANCHVEAGGGNAEINLSSSVATDQTRLIGVEPRHDRFNLGPTARLVVPGEPEQSVLWQRVNRRGAGQMPPLGTTVVDPLGSKLLRDWIKGLGGEVAEPNKSASD
jgi:uncharacterized repeat protein (TIGR03806 family)